MKKILLLAIIGVMLITCYTSCYYDNEEALYPSSILSSDCNTDNVTFSGTILPIFQGYCLSCHSSSNANLNGGGFTFETYAQISSNASLINNCINHTSGYEAMPKNAGKLDDCKLKQFQKWIDNGKLNN